MRNNLDKITLKKLSQLYGIKREKNENDFDLIQRITTISLNAVLTK